MDRAPDRQPDPDFSRRCARALASGYFRGLPGDGLARLRELDAERARLRAACAAALGAAGLALDEAAILLRAEAWGRPGQEAGPAPAAG